MERIGHRIKRFRKRKRWTQLALGAAVGLDHRRVSEFERGRERPSAFDVDRLAEAFGMLPATFVKGTDWGDEPGPTRFQRVFRGPRKYLPKLEREPSERFRRARLDFPELTQHLDALAEASPYRESTRLGEASLPVLSSREALLCLHLFAARGWVEKLAPQQSGFVQLPVIEPDERWVVGAVPVPAVAIYLDSTPHIFFPNTSVRCGTTYYTLDFLVGIKHARSLVWKNLEVDGEAHVSTGDRARTRAIGLPACRVDVADLKRDDFVEDLTALLAS